MRCEYLWCIFCLVKDLSSSGPLVSRGKKYADVMALEIDLILDVTVEIYLETKKIHGVPASSLLRRLLLCCATAVVSSRVDPGYLESKKTRHAPRGPRRSGRGVPRLGGRGDPNHSSGRRSLQFSATPGPVWYVRFEAGVGGTRSS